MSRALFSPSSDPCQCRHHIRNPGARWPSWKYREARGLWDGGGEGCRTQRADGGQVRNGAAARRRARPSPVPEPPRGPEGGGRSSGRSGVHRTGVRPRDPQDAVLKAGLSVLPCPPGPDGARRHGPGRPGPTARLQVDPSCLPAPGCANLISLSLFPTMSTTATSLELHGFHSWIVLGRGPEPRLVRSRGPATHSAWSPWMNQRERPARMHRRSNAVGVCPRTPRGTRKHHQETGPP